MQPGNGQNQKPNLQGVTPAPAVPQPFQAEIVSNIPVKAPAPAVTVAKPMDEGDELDKIMADVGRNLSRIGQKNGKKHLSLFTHHHQSTQPAAQPVREPTKTTVRPRALPPKPSAPRAEPTAAAPATAKPAPPKTQKANAAPLLAITVAILVTGVLIAAAFYAYK